MIEAVFFDAVGTLIYLPQRVGHHYRIVAERHGLHVGEEALESAFRGVWRQMPPRPATNAPRPDDDKGWWRELVSRVFEMVLPLHPLPEGCFEEIYHHFAGPGVWHLHPEVPGVLKALGKNCRLGVISNFDGRLRVILEQLGVLKRFESVIISSEAGADKPAPHIFQLALDSLDVGAGNALHAGDDPMLDWKAATAIGMSVYKLERPKNSLTGLVEYLEKTGSR